MSAPSASWTMIELRWKFVNVDGTIPTGFIEALPYVQKFVVTGDPGLEVLGIKPILAKVGFDGTASMSVPASDDTDVSPNGFTYRITERILGFPETSYHIEAPIAKAGTGIDVSNISPISASLGIPVSLVTRKELDAIQERLSNVENSGGGGGGGGGGGAVASVNNKVGAVVLNQDDVASGTVAKQYTATEKSKLNLIEAGATLNYSNATLLNRANHTGSQTLDSTTDTSTRVAMSPTERTKLGGVATGATANSPNATLLDRPNHTGVQPIASVTGLQTALDASTALSTAIGTNPQGTYTTVADRLNGIDSSIGSISYTETMASAPAGSLFYRVCVGGTWPVRGSSRTDLVFAWVARSVSDPAPTVGGNYAVGDDYWQKIDA